MAQNVERARKKLEAMHYGSPMETWMATDNRAEMARSLANAEQTATGARREQEALASERDLSLEDGGRTFLKNSPKPEVRRAMAGSN